MDASQQDKQTNQHPQHPSAEQQLPVMPVDPADSTASIELPVLQMYRRNLHRIPELDFDLPRTIEYVTSRLEDARLSINDQFGPGYCTVFSPCEGAVCAFFDRASEHTTAIRADMDALPVAGRTGAPYASEHEGRMHACGHDGHMAMVLMLAQWMSAYFNYLPRNVLLVFQPAEETTGGANDICKSGVFEKYNVDRIFGFHLWPDLPAGQIASRPGPLLAAGNETLVRFHGKSSHIAKAADGADAMEACARFYLDAYDYMAQRQKEEPCLLKFGRMEAGTVCNAIAAEAYIHGSLRTFSVEMGERCRRDLADLAQRRAAEAGCTAEVNFADGYPPVVNDAQLYAMASEALAKADAERMTEALDEDAGTRRATVAERKRARMSADPSITISAIDEAQLAYAAAAEGSPDGIAAVPALAPVELPEPLLIAEDFAFYQRHLSGVFLLLGTGTGIPLHADTFDFHESVLLQGLAAYKALVTME